MLGRLIHYTVDAALITTVLAGMRRSTGLTFRTDTVAGDNSQVALYLNKYLGVGETILDQGIALASSSRYFTRTR